MSDEQKVTRRQALIEDMSLLQSTAIAYVSRRRLVRQAVIIDCQKNRQPYRGFRSWPESLRNWIETEHEKLKLMGLCRKDIKKALQAVRKARKENEE